MKNGKEIFIFSLVACAILVLEFFYLPWGSINKNSKESNFVKGVTIDKSITDAHSTSGYTVAQNFSSPSITPTHTFSGSTSRGNYSTSVNYESASTSFHNQPSTYSYRSSVSGSALGSGGSLGINNNGMSSPSSTQSSSFGTSSLSSPSSFGQLGGLSSQSDMSSNTFDGSQAFGSLPAGDKMKKVSMSTLPPPEDPLDADYLFLILAIVFLMYKYIIHLKLKRSEQKKHVL